MPDSPYILVVEDILSVRDLLRVQLEVRGYRVQAVRDGQEALAAIAHEKPAAVITDILMPRVDGFALAHTLRADPATAGIPIIFLSATYVSADDERFALELGALRFFPKPIDSDQLFKALAEVLQQPPPPELKMGTREFYMNYRHRLKSKLAQKDQQIARLARQAASTPDVYQSALDEAEQQRAEIQKELDSLAILLNAEA